MYIAMCHTETMAGLNAIKSGLQVIIFNYQTNFFLIQNFWNILVQILRLHNHTHTPKHVCIKLYTNTQTCVYKIVHKHPPWHGPWSHTPGTCLAVWDLWRYWAQSLLAWVHCSLCPCTPVLKQQVLLITTRLNSSKYMCLYNLEEQSYDTLILSEICKLKWTDHCGL